MKILFSAIMLCGLLFNSDGGCDETSNANLSDFGLVTLAAPTDSAQNKPFSVTSTANWIERAKVDERHHHSQWIDFHTYDLTGQAILYYDESCHEGLGVGLAYNNVYFKWNKNCFFDRKDFNQISLTLLGFTQRANLWNWQGIATINCDGRYCDIDNYSNYDLTLWGRYDYCKDDSLGLHAGFIMLTGMKIDRIYPILGFDWKYNECWKINAIFPLNISIIYSWNSCWSASLAARAFEIRRRVGKHEPLCRGLLEYRNTGSELGLNYLNGNITANIHGGVTFGGKYIISNRNHKNKRRFDIDSSLYYGGEVALKF